MKSYEFAKIQPAYEIELRLSCISWALAQISC